MPRLDFYNLNAHIAFPLLKEEHLLAGTPNIVLPDGVLLDAGFIVQSADPVKLSGIQRSGTNIIFTFTAGTVGFSFSRAADDPFGQLSYSDPGGLNSAYLVTGDLQELYAVMGADGYWTGDYAVEPALVQHVQQTLISLNLGYLPPRPWTPPAECGSSSAAAQVVEVTGTGLTGSRVFMQGYNAEITVKPAGNSIRLAAAKGGGAGPVCGELCGSSVVPQADGVACDDTISAINGVTPDDRGAFLLESGSTGVNITTDASNHKVIIDFTTGNLDAGHCIDD